MSTLTVWTRRDPFAEFDRTFHALTRRAFGPATSRRVVRPAAVQSAGVPSGFVPAAELTRDGDDAVLRLELPGVDVSKDVTVELDQGRLVVRGEKRAEQSAERAGHAYREVRYGSFPRTFRVPEHVSAEAITADYTAGVLSVRVAGVFTEPEPTATRIAITATGGTEVAEPTEQPTEQPTAQAAEPTAQ